MSWQISKLNVDINTDQVIMVVESTPYPSPSLTLNFLMPESAKMKPAAFSLDQVSRAALIAQAKKILTDIVGSL